MTFKLICTALFIFYSFSGARAQEATALEPDCVMPASAAEKLFAATDAVTESAADAVLLKESSRPANVKAFEVLYKGYRLGPLPRRPLSPEPRAVEEAETPEPKVAIQHSERRDGFDWNSAFRQSLLFLSVQHVLRLTQPKTTEELQGKFFADYWQSLKGIKGWNDGDGFVANYLGHPAMGAISGYIQIHNDPRSARLELDNSKAYWKSRAKAFAWSAAYSTQFEIGLLSEATIGNVGKRPGTGGVVDFVITPTMGTFTILLEDVADKYLVKPIEGRTDNFTWVRLARTFLNPMRSLANLLRFKKPWYRDRVQGFAMDDMNRTFKQ